MPHRLRRPRNDQKCRQIPYGYDSMISMHNQHVLLLFQKDGTSVMDKKKFNDIMSNPSREMNAPEEKEDSSQWTPNEEEQSTDSLPPETQEIAWPTSDSDA